MNHKTKIEREKIYIIIKTLKVCPVYKLTKKRKIYNPGSMRPGYISTASKSVDIYLKKKNKKFFQQLPSNIPLFFQRKKLPSKAPLFFEGIKNQQLNINSYTCC